MLAGFCERTLTATAAAYQLNLSPSRLYALTTADNTARAKKSAAHWTPGTSGGDPAQPWPPLVLALLQKRLACTPPCPGLGYRFFQRRAEVRLGFLNHQPEGCEQAHRFAAVKRKEDLFETYGFIACDQKQTDAAWTGERQRLKGGKEQLFGEVLNGMDLHHPPCSALRANEIYYLIAARAYNLMAAVRLLDLNDDCQGWRVRTWMKKLMFLPGRLTRKARQWVAKVLVPGGGLNWWQRWQQNAWPQEHRAGRPRLSAASG